MAIYDISVPVDARLAGWPGDTEYRLGWTCRIAEGSPVNLGEVAMSIHTGTHVDAPFHFADAGSTMDGMNLEAYIGPAIVLDCGEIERIGVGDIQIALGGVDTRAVPRLLFKTGGWPDHSRFPESIPALSEDVPDWLGSRGVTLLGVDVPSVDMLDSKSLPIHVALGRNGIAILESVDLSAVPPGVYELIALPLRLVGADGSPVRAILRGIA